MLIILAPCFTVLSASEEQAGLLFALLIINDIIL